MRLLKNILGAMATSSGFCIWLQIVISLFGFTAGIVTFCVLGINYGNIHCAIWGLLSGFFALAVFYLSMLHRNQEVDFWYTPQQLEKICCLGIGAQLVGAVAFITYISTARNFNKDTFSRHDGYYIIAFWCLMTWMWAFMLSLLSWSMKARLEKENTALLSGVRAHPDEI